MRGCGLQKIGGGGKLLMCLELFFGMYGGGDITCILLCIYRRGYRSTPNGGWGAGRVQPRTSRLNSPT